MRARSRLQLIILGFGLTCALLAPPAAADPVVTGDVEWREDQQGFGGFSGLEVSADGTSFTAISDRGRVVRGRLLRDAEGRLTGAQSSAWDWLTDIDNARMPQWRADAEGLAIRADGRIFVSFESDDPRVWTYRDFQSEAAWLPRPDAFKQLQGNAGLEGLAIDASGALFAVPERSGRLDRPFPVFRYRRGAWDQPFSLPRRGPFLAVGLDFGPDGKLYLLERHLAGIFFVTRMRRFDVSGGQVRSEEEVLLPATGSHDNLEGLSVWRDGAGKIRLTMIADDNFRGFQRTEFVEYQLP